MLRETHIYFITGLSPLAARDTLQLQTLEHGSISWASGPFMALWLNNRTFLSLPTIATSKQNELTLPS